ncbi:MAG: ferrous iron transport protein A [Campylobacterales bacterium]
MNLYEAKKNINYRVKNIDGDSELKSRLASFGISKEASIRVVAYGAMKSTINVEVEESGCVALRHSEAKAIEVEYE